MVYFFNFPTCHPNFGNLIYCIILPLAMGQYESLTVSGYQPLTEFSASMGEGERFSVTLVVNEEQRNAISQLFQEKHWEYSEKNNEGDCQEESASMTPDTSNQVTCSGFTIPQDTDSDECQYCLCRPCITNERNKQQWWELRENPQNRKNNIHRKELYKRFWTMLYHRGAWGDQRYQDKKKQALGIQTMGGEPVWHRRDIMPDCVIKLVRFWFPNPDSMEYMGHLWE
ncbi:hypothetical protein KP79_PYT18901 [Mizuhopecten yessoensis]|uniref:Uncharacterized protein n=1 Tax=Mizuhopecten yessoensis TaxID=6573 RepID=A0A210QZQ7_MIZYE|nr:hypothetical protein KP79_PYT02212 [Mizuhopecten yessoensis]OWF54155.1 hypothetical protein KP79_PYT18901 [Mizuhopecten yessoensis]